MRHILTSVSPLIITCGVFVAGMSGCASMKSAMGMGGDEIALTAADRVPSARGNVVVNVDNNRNKQLKVEVAHLPEPSKLDPDKNRYMIWADPGQGDAVPLGNLQLGPDQSGAATVATPFSSFELLITAEGEEHAKTPSDMVVLRGQVDPTW